ncbi:hypothetical protein SI65_01923 [Aspergillus cristatus]|uniref:Uncharacterized protein n=1 Tax=Aspergillus cristatus TaxID=573508 RepID=A0A1E3BTN3_ASPCR|nr:hypothetical protein SI65_01923 [Aspergillus cristatus]
MASSDLAIVSKAARQEADDLVLLKTATDYVERIQRHGNWQYIADCYSHQLMTEEDVLPPSRLQDLTDSEGRDNLEDNLGSGASYLGEPGDHDSLEPHNLGDTRKHSEDEAIHISEASSCSSPSLPDPDKSELEVDSKGLHHSRKRKRGNPQYNLTTDSPRIPEDRVPGSQEPVSKKARRSLPDRERFRIEVLRSKQFHEAKEVLVRELSHPRYSMRKNHGSKMRKKHVKLSKQIPCVRSLPGS